MNFTTKDFEKAQNLLNSLIDMNNEEIASLTVTVSDLEGVRGLILKKIGDIKKVLEGTEKFLEKIGFEGYHNEMLKTFLVNFKNYDMRINDTFDVWVKYHKQEMQTWNNLDNILTKKD